MPKGGKEVLALLIELRDLLLEEPCGEQGEKKDHQAQAQVPAGGEIAKKEKRESTDTIDEEDVAAPDQDQVSDSDEHQPPVPHEISPGPLPFLNQARGKQERRPVGESF